MSHESDRDAAVQLIARTAELGFLEINDLQDKDELWVYLDEYGFSEEFRSEILKYSILTWEDLLGAIAAVLQILYLNEEYSLDSNTDEIDVNWLSALGFSSKSIDTFRYLVSHPPTQPNHVLTLYFSRDVSLNYLAELEEAFNSVFRQAALSSGLTDYETRVAAESGAQLVRLDTITHPGSAAVFLVGVMWPGGLIVISGIAIMVGCLAWNDRRKREEAHAASIRYATARAQSPSSSGPHAVTPISKTEEGQLADEAQQLDLREVRDKVLEGMPESGDSIGARTANMLTLAEAI